eukprot:3156465-Prymnesium_polylepis.2
MAPRILFVLALPLASCLLSGTTLRSRAAAGQRAQRLTMEMEVAQFPDATLTPDAVVEAQLTALQETDFRRAFRFSTPEHKRATGRNTCLLYTSDAADDM